MRNYAKRCADRSNRCRNIVIFIFLGCRPAAPTLDFLNFKFVTDQTVTGLNCYTLTNFVEIAETAAEIWRFFKMTAAAMLDF